jgi:hypothetical protein
MARYKFPTFAVAVLALWIWQTYAMGPTLGTRAVETASIQAARAPAGVAVKIDERRREFQKAALMVANAPAALAALRNRTEAPVAERFGALRSLALESVPPLYRNQLVVALTNEHGSIYSRGSETPSTDPSAFNVPTLARAGVEGLEGIWQEAFGGIHLFFSYQVAAFEKGEPRILGTLVLGAPLLAEGLLDSAAKEAGLGALLLVQAGKVLATGGPDKGNFEKLDPRTILPGKTVVAVRGSVFNLGFLGFPMWTSSDVLGGNAPLWVASRQAIRATPYEAIGLASTRGSMEAFALHQRTALFLMLAVLSLTVAWMLFPDFSPIPARTREDYGLRRPEPFGDKPRTANAEARSEPATNALEEPPPVPQPPFQPASNQEGAPEQTAPGVPSRAHFGTFVEDEPTMAYPSSSLPSDAFAKAEEGVHHPEETRVAEVPEELLRASARLEAEGSPQVKTPPPRPPPLPSASKPTLDEPHFREVFGEFVATRERCGEAADGLTYDRFAQKLRKSRDQLIEKYHCKTVRFQVYVKEGKAALKATPIKD